MSSGRRFSIFIYLSRRIDLHELFRSFSNFIYFSRGIDLIFMSSDGSFRMFIS